MQLALLFQALGYYGRCSFDAIVYGTSLNDARIHWIECNGQWGGFSIQMALANRLSGAGERPPHVIAQKSDLAFRPRDFSAVESEFSDLEPSPDLTSGVLFLNPNLIVNDAGCHFLSLGPSRQSAIDQSKRVVARLLA